MKATFGPVRALRRRTLSDSLPMTTEAKLLNQMRILTTGDDAALHALYFEAFASPDTTGAETPPFVCQTCRDGKEALNQVRAAREGDRPFAVAFLDLKSGSGSRWEDVGRRIREIDADINFVVITESDDTDAHEMVARLLPTDKLLLAQKPLHVQQVRQLAEILCAKWRSERLLRLANVELQQRLDELERSRLELIDHKGELETVNNQLLETNDALSVLARNLESARRESEKQVLRKTRTLILPVLQKLRQDRRLDRYRTDLDLLAGYIKTLTTDISDKTRNAEVLSATESRIASMIRLGLTSEEIADHLSVSVSTVKTHRKNIRRKLRLKNTGKNLRSYLESRFASE